MCFVVYANILKAEVSVKAAGDCAEEVKAEPLVQAPSVDVAGNNRVKLHDFKAESLCTVKAVAHELFADVQTAAFRGYGIARVCYVTAPADIIGVQNIKTEDFAAFVIQGNSAAALRGEKLFSAFVRKTFFLRKSHAFKDNLVPYINHGGNIGFPP